MDVRSQPAHQIEEPTLGALLLRIAREKTPRRFYQAIQLAFPWAAWLATMGWWRLAGAATTIGCFGAWALADRWLYAEPRSGWRRTAARVTRVAAAVIAAALTILLVLELYLRLQVRAPNH